MQRGVHPIPATRVAKLCALIASVLSLSLSLSFSLSLYCTLPPYSSPHPAQCWLSIAATIIDVHSGREDTRCHCNKSKKKVLSSASHFLFSLVVFLLLTSLLFILFSRIDLSHPQSAVFIPDPH